MVKNINNWDEFINYDNILNTSPCCHSVKNKIAFRELLKKVQSGQSYVFLNKQTKHTFLS